MPWINLTPHTICFQLPSGGRQEIPPSGVVARVDTIEEQVTDGVLPIIRRSYGPVTGLPAHERGNKYLVSSMVLDRVSGRFDVFAPDTGKTAIRENGQVVAVTRLVETND